MPCHTQAKRMVICRVKVRAGEQSWARSRVPVRAQHSFPGLRAPGVPGVPGFPLAIPTLQPGFLPNEISDTKRRFFCCF